MAVNKKLMWNYDDRDSSSGWDSSPTGGQPAGFGIARPRTTPVVRMLLTVNVAVFALQTLVQVGSADLSSQVIEWFGLSFDRAIMKLNVWQFVSYMFLHGGLFHVLFNLFGLWMFGCEVESAIGRKRFLQLYFLSGICAGLAYVTWGAFGRQFVPAVGASGAIMAILVVFTILAPNRTVLLFFMIPMKMKHMMWLILAFDMYYFVLNDDSGGVANTAHLGGALFGFLWFRWSPRISGLFDRLEREAHRRDQLKAFDARAEVDRLLAKINREGLTALTTKERRFLEQASKKFYDSK